MLETGDPLLSFQSTVLRFQFVKFPIDRCFLYTGQFFDFFKHILSGGIEFITCCTSWGAVCGHPPFCPLALAAASPSFVRSSVTSRSDSAMADIRVKSSLPDGVLVSTDSFRLTRCTCCVPKSSTRSIKSFVEHPSRDKSKISNTFRNANNDQVVSMPANSIYNLLFRTISKQLVSNTILFFK